MEFRHEFPTLFHMLLYTLPNPIIFNKQFQECLEPRPCSSFKGNLEAVSFFPVNFTVVLEHVPFSANREAYSNLSYEQLNVKASIVFDIESSLRSLT